MQTIHATLAHTHRPTINGMQIDNKIVYCITASASTTCCVYCITECLAGGMFVRLLATSIIGRHRSFAIKRRFRFSWFVLQVWQVSQVWQSLLKQSRLTWSQPDRLQSIFNCLLLALGPVHQATVAHTVQH